MSNGTHTVYEHGQFDSDGNFLGLAQTPDWWVPSAPD